VDRAKEKKYSNLWIASAGTDSPRQFTQGDQSDTGPIWSRGGENIAFFSDRQRDEQSQIFVMPARGGESRPVTDMKGEFGYMERSPDGKQIAFEFRAKSQEEIEEV
jgi:Tol biopolymer transport system component